MVKLRASLTPALKCQTTPTIRRLRSFLHGHPRSPTIFLGLALKVPHPGEFLSPGTAGHLLLPFFVNQFNCDPPTYHLRGKGVTTLSL